LYIGQKLPKLKKVHNFWQYESQGKLITEFLSSLDKITPSVEDTSIANLRYPTQGPPELTISDDHATDDRFMDAGNAGLLDIDFISYGFLENEQKEQKGLPLSVILNTVKRIFPKEYDQVDFGHSLTALDYLRDMELTRRSKLRRAAERLEITLQTWRSVLADNPDALRWIELVQKYELIIEEGYARIFVDVRIWVSQE
jgi:hypothetical protein